MDGDTLYPIGELAQLSEDERQRLIGDFLDAVFGGLGSGATFAGVMRSMTPELPGDPSAEQVQAWVELAELALDPDFRAGVRRMAKDHASEQERSGTAGPRRDFAAVVRDQAGPAVAEGIDPASRRADPIVAALAARYALVLGHPDDAELRRRLLSRLENVNDPRRDRYLRLLAMINGWPAPESLAPVFHWSARAVRVRMER